MCPFGKTEEQGNVGILKNVYQHAEKLKDAKSREETPSNGKRSRGGTERSAKHVIILFGTIVLSGKQRDPRCTGIKGIHCDEMRYDTK